LLIAGVGGLGYVGATQNAVAIQSAIAADAREAVEGSRYSVQTQVTGRDVSVTGQVSDQTELALLQAMLQSVDGVRVVDVSGVDTLPMVDQYTLTATRQVDGSTALSGVVPSDADLRRLTENIAGLTPNLTLAAGVPDADWVDVARLGLTALGTLKDGEMTLTDRTLLLRGLARNPDELNITLGGLERLPEAYSLIAEIDLEDDGTPLRLMLVLRDGVITGEGKFPSDITATAIEEIFRTADTIAIDQAVIAAFDPQWPVVARTAMQGLSQLIDGVLEIERRDVSLIGTGTPDAIAQVGTLLATVPETFSVTVDLGLWDDGAPLEFIMEWNGMAALRLRPGNIRRASRCVTLPALPLQTPEPPVFAPP
jgi:OOP family OmpA-OmpF porin